MDVGGTLGTEFQVANPQIDLLREIRDELRALNKNLTRVERVIVGHSSAKARR